MLFLSSVFLCVLALWLVAELRRGCIDFSNGLALNLAALDAASVSSKFIQRNSPAA